MEWLTIESAPKDGTFILLWLRDPFCAHDILRWEPRVSGWVSAYWDVNDEGFCGSLVPSHWMPLPPPPLPKEPA